MADNEPDDDELLVAWRAGSRHAGEALIRRMYPKLQRFLGSKCGDEVEELIQETFSRAVTAKDRFEGRSSATTFLYGIARNVLREHYRKRRGDVDVDELSVRDLGAGPSTLRWRRLEDQLLLEGLRTLPLQMQMALELYFWDDFNKREIAEILDVPEGTVASRIDRGRRRLRAILHGNLPGATSVDAGGVGGDDDSLDGWADRLREGVPVPVAAEDPGAARRKDS